MVPAWLRRLIDEGTPKPLEYKRHALLTICDRCMMRVLAVHEDYPYGRNVLVNPEPLNSIGEAWALQGPFDTYAMHGMSADGIELDKRIMFDVLIAPCGKVLPSGTVIRVVMQHVCGLDIPHTYREGM